MKHLLLFIITLCLSLTAYGQKEGTIQYVRVTQLSFDAPEGMEDMFKNMPKEQSSEKVLLYSGKKSIYQNPDDKIGSDDNMINLGDDEMSIQIDFNEPDEKFYMDLDSDLTLHQQEFFNKQFLVKGSPTKIDWKLGKGKKKIAGYICMEATTMVEDTIPMTAWFTPQIPVSIGPKGYGGLPGMILQIDRNKGDQIITASHVDLSPPALELITPPTKGKKVSKEQYENIVADKMAEMKAQTTGGGATFIEIRQ